MVAGSKLLPSAGVRFKYYQQNIMCLLFLSVLIVELGVTWCTSCHVTQQSVCFTKIHFLSQVIETSGWDQKIDRIHFDYNF